MLLRRRFYSASSNGKVDTSKDYFNIKSLEDNNSISFTNTIYYSINNGNWNTLLSGESVTINTTDRIYFKAELTPTSADGIGTFTISNQCEVSGNIMSLLYGDNFEDKTDLTGKNYAFRYLFDSCKTIISAYDLILPATILSTYCYHYMFYGCTSLTKAPELPATTLANSCYSNMFYGCTSLTKAPELPARTLANYCYSYMFGGCTSLTTAPELPATTLVGYCYQYMFYGCTSLMKAPKLPTIYLTSYCYYHMFDNCSNLTTAPELPARTLANYCYAYMFKNCRNLLEIPELPAVILKPYCYNYMFNGCKNITHSGELPARLLVNYCYQNMFNSCSSLQHIISMATDISATNCLNGWTTAVSGYGDFLKNPDTDINIWPNGISGIPNGWHTGSYYGEEDTTDYRKEYFTLEAVTDGEMTLYKPSGYSSSSLLQYSFNNNNWTDFSDTITINVVKGDKIRIKSYIGYGTYNYSSSSRAFDSTGYYKVYGNILSLLCGNEFEDIKDCIDYDIETYNTYYCDLNNIANISTFQSLFNNSSTLVSAKNLILPFATLTINCYQYMFNGCINLTEAPELPATNLEYMCYVNMFNGCTSLIKAPELPAVTLANRCYGYMFYNCTNLEKSPKLPANELPASCYAYMFYGCTRIKEITMLATNITSTTCLTSWVNSVASSGTFYKHPSLSIDTIGYGTSGIPEGWNIEDSDKINFENEYFTVKILEDGEISFCEPTNSEYMYYSLNREEWIDIDKIVTLTVQANDNIRLKCKHTGLWYIKSDGLISSKIKFNIYGNIMSMLYGDDFIGQTSLEGHDNCFDSFLNYSKVVSAKNLILPATTLANSCYSYMFFDCTSLTKAPELLPAMTLSIGCYSCMFECCTSLIKAPKLPATTLADNCYEFMFADCSNLNEITMLAIDISATSCLNGWVMNVASSGTLYKHPNLSIDTIGYGDSGIPEGWAIIDYN